MIVIQSEEIDSTFVSAKRPTSRGVTNFVVPLSFLLSMLSMTIGKVTR